mmetsp:Transcript_9520/g.17922  ORF Transcript_9520/g.17922 Transcript_9520/m.17922 type:complete len:226 (+) Transcript_9520:757-1434(+)
MALLFVLLLLLLLLSSSFFFFLICLFLPGRSPQHLAQEDAVSSLHVLGAGGDPLHCVKRRVQRHLIPRPFDDHGMIWIVLIVLVVSILIVGFGRNLRHMHAHFYILVILILLALFIVAFVVIHRDGRRVSPSHGPDQGDALLQQGRVDFGGVHLVVFLLFPPRDRLSTTVFPYEDVRQLHRLLLRRSCIVVLASSPDRPLQKVAVQAERSVAVRILVQHQTRIVL